MTKEIYCTRDMDNGSEVSHEFFIIHLCDISTTIHHKKAENEMGVAMGSKMGENRNDFFYWHNVSIMQDELSSKNPHECTSVHSDML